MGSFFDDYTWDGLLPRKKTFIEKHKKEIEALALLLGISFTAAADKLYRERRGSSTENETFE